MLKSSATLRRRLSGWKLWADYARDQVWFAGEPPEAHLVGFLRALVEGGSHNGAKHVISSLKFVAGIMGWTSWLHSLSSQVVVAWCNPEAGRQARKEALPLPLFAVAALEHRLLGDIATHFSQDSMYITAFLLMLWGALRFSDLQRASPDTLQVEAGVVRGRCWKTKSSAQGMPFGVLCLGILNDWSAAVHKLIVAMRDCDFLLAGPRGAQAILRLFWRSSGAFSWRWPRSR